MLRTYWWERQVSISRPYVYIDFFVRLDKGFFFFFELTYIVLLTELLGERGAHDVAADTGGGLEVCLAGLAPRRVDCCERGIVSTLHSGSMETEGINRVKHTVLNLGHCDGLCRED